MDLYQKYRSPLGYEVGDEFIDSYGVNHSGFNTQDELAYQMARDKREKQLIENYNQHGITENYPQAGTNFWGDAENNYGFGSSDIAETISTHPAMNTSPVPILQSPTTIDSNNSFSDSYGGVSDYGSVLDGLNENTNKTSITSTLQSQTPTPWNPTVVPTSTTSTPWRNNQTLTPWNGGYDLSAPNTQSNSNYISDEDLYARMWENVKQFENVIPYPYLDTKGLITIGGGANVNDWNVFKNLNVTVDGVPATEAQKWEAYNHMRQLSEAKDANGNYLHHNTEAENFAPHTNVRISDAEARGLAQNHMINDLAYLRRKFSDFDSFPLPLKEVLLDIQYNTGNLNQRDWPNSYRAIRNHDVNGIVENVNRKDVQQSRNDWAKRIARSIRF